MLEEKILSPDFLYEQPFFYNNELSYRCELGRGKTNREYMKNAVKRAMCIFDILFPEKVDALFFGNIHYDYDTSGEEECVCYDNIIKFEKECIRFSLKMQKKYKHCKIRLHDAVLDEDLREDDDVLAVNRIFCEVPPKADCKKYIKDQIESRKNPLVHFVSYDLQCIFSVYDDRGCDIVFFDKASYVKMYDKIKQYFLENDLLLMDERVQRKCVDEY